MSTGALIVGTNMLGAISIGSINQGLVFVRHGLVLAVHVEEAQGSNYKPEASLTTASLTCIS